MTTSPFKKWFEEQHGKRSNRHERDDELCEIASKGKAAQEELERRALYDARYQSALYAWAVNDADK